MFNEYIWDTHIPRKFLMYESKNYEKENQKKKKPKPLDLPKWGMYSERKYGENG